MSASVRFLAMAVIGWAGIRAVTLGSLPGAEAFTLSRFRTHDRPLIGAGVPAIVPTEFPALEPPQPLTATAILPPTASAVLPAAARTVARLSTQTARLPAPAPAAGPLYFYPVGPPAPVPYAYASLPAPRPGRLTPPPSEPAAAFYAPIPQLDEWPLSRMASAAMPIGHSSTGIPQQSVPQAALKARFDRLQLSAWALLRGRPGPSSLATGGTLGGSQGGARLTYAVTPAIAASLRTSSPVGGGRGGEVAAGMRLTPFRSIPVSLTVERRQAIGRLGGGRTAFAAFLEGGIYQQPILWGFSLDAYAQGGVVGLRSRDLFFDGGYTLTRPLFGRCSDAFRHVGRGPARPLSPRCRSARVDEGPQQHARSPGLAPAARRKCRAWIWPGGDPSRRLLGDAQPSLRSLAFAVLCG